MNFSSLSAEQQERYCLLTNKLEESQLIVRYDSDLFWDYVFHGKEARFLSIDIITLKLQKAKYLHEYCNFKLGYEIAKNTLGNQTIPKEDWLALLRKCVLTTTKLRVYPEYWPWETGITPEVWKNTNDRTYEIKKFCHN
jgi:hypothetical protein